MFARPGVNDATFIVIKVRLLATGINQIVTGARARIIEQNAMFFGAGCWGLSLLRGVILRSGFFCGIFRGFGVSRPCENRGENILWALRRKELATIPAHATKDFLS